MAGTEALGPLMDRWGDADLILVLTSPVWTLRRERERERVVLVGRAILQGSQQRPDGRKDSGP